MSEISVQSVEFLIKDIAEKRKDVEALKKTYSDANAELEELERKAIGMLKALGKSSFKGELGTITRVEKWRVNLPATDQDRENFFAYLRERGLFEKMITVNSNSLNSFYMQEWEQVKESDPMEALNFRIPGISEPKAHETLSFRKK